MAMVRFITGNDSFFRANDEALSLLAMAFGVNIQLTETVTDEGNGRKGSFSAETSLAALLQLLTCIASHRRSFGRDGEVLRFKA